MKLPIRSKLFAAISGLILFYVFLSFVLNNQFLVDYYYLNKKNTLKNNFEYVDKIYQGDPYAISLELERIERTEGLHIVIQDPVFTITYNSYFKEEGFPRRQIRLTPILEIPGMPGALILRDIPNVKPGEPLVLRSVDHRLNSEFINLIGLLNNGDYIFMSTPVVSIEESAQIANKFFLFTGLFTILTGLIIVFVFSGRFTRPILQLNEIAQRMSRLDFSQKYPIKTSDEIGQLGQSINSLSEQLEGSIMELRDANEKLRQDIERERKIDDMRREFISNVSHELKTPIALIQGYAEGLKVNVSQDERDKDFYCDVIVDEAGKMNRLVKQLLDLSQIDAGYIRLDATEFDLSLLIEHVIKKNELILNEQKINLIKDIRPGVMVSADPDRIEQVIVNYLTNAISHVDDRRKITVALTVHANKAKVSITNSGSHIPEEAADKIWTSFYKGDKSRNRAYGGTGLGLSIVKALMELHGNAYGVENVDEGVAFWFEADLIE